MGHLKGVGKVYLQAVVDTCSSYAFGLLATSKKPGTAALLLHNEVLPFYREKEIEVSALLTDSEREFRGTQAHPYELYLELNNLEHQGTRRCASHRRTASWSASTARCWISRFHEQHGSAPAGFDQVAPPLQPRAAPPGLPKSEQTTKRDH